MEQTLDTTQSKASMLLLYSDCSDLSESDDMMKPAHMPVSPPWHDNRPIRRVCSPSRPRAWVSTSYKPKFGGKFNKYLSERDYPSVYKPGPSGSQRQQHPNPQPYLKMRDHYPPKSHHSAVRAREKKRVKEEWEKERERGKEWHEEWEKDSGRYEWRENSNGSSPLKQNASRPFAPRSSSSRDKDTYFTICRNNWSHSREGDQRGSKSKEREQSRDWELPLTASQRTARDRAIQQKRREIDEIYYQECEMFGLVTKMLIKKEPSLEGLIQSSLQQNLQDIGKRCLEAMERFIEEYDSRELMY